MRPRNLRDRPRILTVRFLPGLLRIQVGLIGLLGSGLAAQLEFGTGRIVLDVVVNVVAAGERLAGVRPLAAGRADGGQHEAEAGQGRLHPEGRFGLGHKWFSAIITTGTSVKVGANVTVNIDRGPV
jgi:hypothetical protein